MWLCSWREVVTGTSATLQLKLTSLQLLQLLLLPHPVLPVSAALTSLALSLCTSQRQFQASKIYCERGRGSATFAFAASCAAAVANTRRRRRLHFLFLTRHYCTRLGGIRGREDPLPTFCASFQFTVSWCVSLLHFFSQRQSRQ